MLVLAPAGQDGALVERFLSGAGYQAQGCPDLAACCREIRSGIGCAVVAEEALAGDSSELRRVLDEQPAWSDLPLIVLTRPSRNDVPRQGPAAVFHPRANVSLLERPLRVVTLLRAVESALRARRRQYEVRGFQESLERRVRERTAELEAALRELRLFSYSLSHDLRSPIRSIAGQMTVFFQEFGGALSPEARARLENVLEGTTRLDRLIDDILAYIRSVDEPITDEPVDAETIVRELLRELEGTIRQRKAVVRVEGPLPGVLGNRTLLTRVFANLIGNALKFVPASRTPEVRVRAENLGTQVRFWVEDNGVGIEAADVSRLFQLFERLHSRSEYPGSGVGLALVKRVVERHGGSTGVESEPDRGSRFWVELRKLG